MRIVICFMKKTYKRGAFSNQTQCLDECVVATNFKSGVVLGHVGKNLRSLVIVRFAVGGHGTPNVTYATVSAPALSRRCDACSISPACKCQLRAMPDRQTLRACSEIVPGPLARHSSATCQTAKRYVCASSAFAMVETSSASQMLTRWRPPIVTHVMVFACVTRAHKTQAKPMNYQAFHC